LPKNEVGTPKAEKIVLVDPGRTLKMDAPALTGPTNPPTSTPPPPRPVSSPNASHRTLMARWRHGIGCNLAVWVWFTKPGNPDWIPGYQPIGGAERRQAQNRPGGGHWFCGGRQRQSPPDSYEPTCSSIEARLSLHNKDDRSPVSRYFEHPGGGHRLPGRDSIDPDIDLALIVVECPTIHPLKVRKFDDVTVGEPVVAGRPPS